MIEECLVFAARVWPAALHDDVSHVREVPRLVVRLVGRDYQAVCDGEEKVEEDEELHFGFWISDFVTTQA